MRIIGGYLKGRRLNPKGKLKSRPTTDFAKEAVFNILENKIDLDGLDVLDLFAGTGNITFEFISRGAGSVTSIDIESGCIDCIRSFAKELEVTDVTTVKVDIFKWLTKPKEKSFDLVFADPPYAHERIKELPENIIKSGLLKENGWLVVEHGKDIDFSTYPFFGFHRKYGGVNFSFFEFIKEQ